MAMYRRLAAENASTYGRTPGMIPTAPYATSAPTMPEAPEATLSSRARPRLYPAASLLYIAMSDLIPDLHRGAIDANALRQVFLIAAGIGTIVVFEKMLN